MEHWLGQGSPPFSSVFLLISQVVCVECCVLCLSSLSSFFFPLFLTVLSYDSILMFGDGKWISDDAQAHQYDRWERAVRKALQDDQTAKMVVVEIGAGIRVGRSLIIIL